MLLSAIYPCTTVMSESHSLNALIAALAMAENNEMTAASCIPFQDFPNFGERFVTPFRILLLACSFQ